MKKFFALMLALLMVLSMAACGEAPSTTPTAGNIDDTIETTGATDATEYVFAEQSIYESDTCAILITDVNPENPGGYALNVTLANNTEPEEITKIEYSQEVDEDGNVAYIEEGEYVETVSNDLVFVLESVAVNGTAVDLKFSSQLESSSRNFDQLIFSEETLKDIEGDITAIDLTFRVYDAKDPSVDLVNVTSTVYPMGNNEAPSAATEAAEG